MTRFAHAHQRSHQPPLSAVKTQGNLPMEHSAHHFRTSLVRVQSSGFLTRVGPRSIAPAYAVPGRAAALARSPAPPRSFRAGGLLAHQLISPCTRSASPRRSSPGARR
mmetsp:Transcript_30441/g.76135  ORF Transcript_30441/g.76135 Transcript_30441/m.76135 type:complete len:108 (+) Transcript_30441:262-585(+)